MIVLHVNRKTLFLVRKINKQVYCPNLYYPLSKLQQKVYPEMPTTTLLKMYFDSAAFAIVHEHSRMVAAKALRIARYLENSRLDLQFIEEAALLHDIGVSRVLAPHIHCHGSAPYICHGILGRQILEREGLPRHAMVAERHVGVGLTAKDIYDRRLPLPQRDMSPLSLEEKIVCFADLFYSKKPGQLAVEKSTDEIRTGLERFGADKTGIFDQWIITFGASCHPNHA